MTSAAFVAFCLIRYRFNIYYHDRLPDRLSNFMTYPVISAEIVLFPLTMLALYWLTGFYNDTLYKSRIQVLGNTAFNALAATIIFAMTAMLNDTMPMRRLNYELMACLTGLLLMFVGSGRWIIATLGARRIFRREWTQPALIIGATRAAVDFADRLDNLRKPMGFDIQGFVDIGDGPASPSPRPLYSLENLEEVCSRLPIKSLIVVSDKDTVLDIPRLLGRLMALDIPVLVKPRVGSTLTGLPRFSNVSGEPLVDITRPRISPWLLNLKRVSDIAVGSIALVVTLPVMACVALAVKLDSPGPVFYRQKRAGYHRRPFTIYKFRSMKTDAETTGPALSSENDPRVTRVGHFLRKYRLDELPNFWNVVRGDMSLVGPRPERDHYVRMLLEREPYYALIHSVRPGITSWGMVKYGYARTIDEMTERLRYDLLYIENMSPGVDLKILFYTVHTVITGRGI